MRNMLLIMMLSLLLGSLVAQGETPMEKSRRLSEGKPGAERDSLWWEGMLYREWITDVNSVDDGNENLDAEVFNVADGKIRAYPSRVYFYNDIDLAIRVSVETKMPLAFYIMDHSCAECLYSMPELYMDPDVIAKSRDFINVYVTYPYNKKRISEMRLMTSSQTVQFMLPGLRRLRVISAPSKDKLIEGYELILKYIGGLSEDELLKRPIYR